MNVRAPRPWLALWTTLVWMAVIAGCTAPPPDSIYYDTTTPPDLFSLPDMSASCPSTPTLQAPVVDKPPQQTCHTPQVFRGTAAGATTITARSQAGVSKPAKVDAKGRFCIEVVLNKDSANTVILTPLDKNGCRGRELQVPIEHKTCATPDGGAPSTSFNAALGGKVTSSDKPSKGKLADINDGDFFTVVELAGGWGWSEVNIWVDIALKKAVSLDRIRIRWRDTKSKGCDYASKYRVLINPNATPGDPDLKKSGTWIELSSVTAGDGGDDVVIPKTTNTLAAHVAIWMHSNGCNGWTETFAISDLEVWGRVPGGSPLTPDRCLGN